MRFLLLLCFLFGSYSNVISDREQHLTKKPVLFGFSSNIGSNMVLQREPASAAVYGYLGDGYTLPAKVQILFNGKAESTDGDSQGNWKFILPPMATGGNYTISAECLSGCKDAQPGTISNVTFGDVFFCSGQSNMWLPLQHTFSRNETLAAIQHGKYHNIRIWRMHDVVYSMEPNWVLQRGGGPWWTAQQATEATFEEHWCSMPGHCYTSKRPVLMEFSATCWYWAQSMVDLMGDTVPIGLIQSAVGGTMIEAWTINSTINNCKETSCGKPQIPWAKCGGLFNGQTAPWVNMTLKGWLWYQGENNAFAPPGNSLAGTGYGCMQPNLINGWRKIWSVVPGTTDSMAPFGLVQLAGGTDEGQRIHFPVTQWAQTANYGVVPNPAMQNCFLATAYDLPEPWDPNCIKANCCISFIPEPPHCRSPPGHIWAYDKTNWFMGPIHPRDKLPLGKRLAMAGHSIIYNNMKSPWTGPIVQSCEVQGKAIMLTFNSSTIFGQLEVQAYNKTVQGSSTYVCIDEANPPVLPNTTRHSCWKYVDITYQHSTTVKVDISKLKGTPTGIQYGWSTDACCGHTRRAWDPCHPASCPILSQTTKLPAMPFFAHIVNGKCKCIPPQQC